MAETLTVDGLIMALSEIRPSIKTLLNVGAIQQLFHYFCSNNFDEQNRCTINDHFGHSSSFPGAFLVSSPSRVLLLVLCVTTTVQAQYTLASCGQICRAVVAVRCRNRRSRDAKSIVTRAVGQSDRTCCVGGYGGSLNSRMSLPGQRLGSCNAGDKASRRSNGHP